LRAVAANSQDLLNRNTNVDCYEFSHRVLLALNDPHWGHVGKTSGEGQFPLPGLGVRKGRDGNDYVISGVSHDAIYYCAVLNPNGSCAYSGGDWQVDLLGNGNDGPDPLGSPARPQWSVIPQMYYRPQNPFIAVTTSPAPTPTPTPTPVPVVDLREVNAKLDVLSVQVATLSSQVSNLSAKLDDQSSQLNSVASRVEAVLTSNDRIVRQLLAPPDYKGSVFGAALTLRPTVKPVTP
jgi:hypothetical protein